MKHFVSKYSRIFGNGGLSSLWTKVDICGKMLVIICYLLMFIRPNVHNFLSLKSSCEYYCDLLYDNQCSVFQYLGIVKYRFIL